MNLKVPRLQLVPPRRPGSDTFFISQRLGTSKWNPSILCSFVVSLPSFCSLPSIFCAGKRCYDVTIFDLDKRLKMIPFLQRRRCKREPSLPPTTIELVAKLKARISPAFPYSHYSENLSKKGKWCDLQINFIHRVALARIVGFVYIFWKFLLQFSSIPGCTAAVVWPTSQRNCQENLWQNLISELTPLSVVE